MQRFAWETGDRAASKLTLRADRATRVESARKLAKDLKVGVRELYGSPVRLKPDELSILRLMVESPVTPDGRYFVVRDRLWRRANPALSDADRTALVQQLMSARRAVGAARRASDVVAERAARAAVDAAKRALGERGPVWWTDGAPDYNRRIVRATPYAAWYAQLGDSRNATTR